MNGPLLCAEVELLICHQRSSWYISPTQPAVRGIHVQENSDVLFCVFQTGTLKTIVICLSVWCVEVEDEGDIPKTLVKLRRMPSDAPRPASTPPVIAATAIQDEDDEEKIIAELEVRLIG